MNTVTGQIYARVKNTYTGLTNGYKDILFGEGIEISCKSRKTSAFTGLTEYDLFKIAFYFLRFSSHTRICVDCTAVRYTLLSYHKTNADPEP
jgi:hypothetical protein